MAIRLVHKGPSYGFTLTTPVIQSGQTEREAVDYVKTVIIPKTFPDVEEIHEIDESEIPPDISFMAAWEWED